MMVLFLIGFVLFLLITCNEPVGNITGECEIKDSTKDDQRYTSEAMRIRNKYTHSAPKYDSSGSYSLSGSQIDKTGIYSEEYKEEMRKLDEKYGRPGSVKHIKAKAKSAAYESGIKDPEVLETIAQNAVKGQKASEGEREDSYEGFDSLPIEIDENDQNEVNLSVIVESAPSNDYILPPDSII